MGSSCSNAASTKVEDLRADFKDANQPDEERHPKIVEEITPDIERGAKEATFSNGSTKQQTLDDDEEYYESDKGQRSNVISADKVRRSLAEAPIAAINVPYQFEEVDATDSGKGATDTGQDEFYKLIYFAGVRLRAEPSRLILRYAQVPYEDQLIKFEDWPSYKSSTPMGVLPVLRTAKGDLCQTLAIARYLARKYDLAGKDNWDSARMDMLMCGLVDLFNDLKPVYTETNDKKRGDLWRQAKDEVLTPFLEIYTKLFDENQTGWFVGNELSWVDLAVSDFLATLSNTFDDTLLNDFSSLRNHTEAVLALPDIQTYLSERPPGPI